MAKQIGRLNSLGLGKESTPGTLVAPTVWIPIESFNLAPKITPVKNTSGYANIAENSDHFIQKQMAELSASGIVRSQSFGHLLLGTFGTVAAPSLVETGVYTHAFTLANTNAHPSYTAYRDNLTQEELSPYQMVSSLQIGANTGEQVKFKLSMMGQQIADTSANTPTFLSGLSQDPFLASQVVVKMATDVAGLGAATEICARNVNITFEKNLLQEFCLGSTTFNSQHNQQFGLAGDMELLYDTDTYKDLFTAGTKQAMSITITGETLIGATQFNKLEIILNSVSLDEWDRSDSNNDLMTQTLGFTGLYKLADTAIASANLTNTRSTTY